MPYTAVVFGGECSDVEIKKHQDHLDSANVILGIGGGKTLDTTKAVVYLIVSRTYTADGERKYSSFSGIWI